MLPREDPADDPPPNIPTDSWLLRMVERACAREQQAFAILFEHYKTKICTYITRLVRHEGVALDLTQETFFKAWLALPNLHNPASFKSWLYRIATCEAHAYLRHRRSINHLPWEEDGTSPTPTCFIIDGPEKQVEEAELTKWLLAQLPLQHRTCLLLQIEGFTQREIAELVGITEKNVSVCISRAREQCRRIRRHLKGEIE